MEKMITESKCQGKENQHILPKPELWSSEAAALTGQSLASLKVLNYMETLDPNQVFPSPLLSDQIFLFWRK